jgi:hypothetical protein
MNSEVQKVRAQELGAPSREVVKSRGARIAIGSREWEDHWIRNPIAYHAFGGSKVERGHFQHQKSRSAECGGSCEHVAEPQGGPRVVDRWTRTARGKESTLLLNSHVLGIHEIRAWELDTKTHEAMSSERH